VSENHVMMPVVQVRNLTKSYRLGRQIVPALQGVSLEVQRGEFVAVMGPSGSGKSTFLNLIGLLDRPTRGDYWLDGIPVARMSSDERAAVRNSKIGFIFQGFNLLAHATALANVEMPLIYAGLPPAERQRRATSMLRQVGLGHRLSHRPTELSGGQQQRVAIARALVNRPAIILADEPTGNLDSHTSVEIMAILQALNQVGITIIMVTHEPDIAAYARRHVAFHDGTIASDSLNTTPRLATLALASAREVSAS
jgi:putative ABC transport system ATP-binding protein